MKTVVSHKERQHDIDIVKGLLIVLVVLHHLPSVVASFTYKGSTLQLFDDFLWIYGCFFMQAFMFFSGYCTNYWVEFKLFTIKKVKSLLVPGLFFTFLMRLFSSIVFRNKWFLVDLLSKNYWLMAFEDYWFLSVLFGCSIVYWLIRHYCLKDWSRLIVLTILLLLNFYLLDTCPPNEDVRHYHNYFHWKHVLGMCFFVGLGDIASASSQFSTMLRKYLTVVFIPALLVCFFLGINIPVYTHKPPHFFYQAPLYLFFATSGTMFIWTIARLVGRNSVLEFLGRNSIFIYITHIFILRITIAVFLRFIQTTNVFSSLTLYVCVGLVTVVMCAYLSRLFNLKPLRFLVGKF